MVSRILIAVLAMSLTCEAQLLPKNRKDTGPKPKNIHGVVTDLRGKPLVGARVFIRDMKTNLVRTLTTGQDGLYNQFALPPAVDYEVSADFKGKASEKKIVSSFLNREDNILNFQLDVAVIEGGIAEPSDAGATFRSFDLVELHASFELPAGVPAPIPAVLLLHGYGEDRSIWKDFSRQLLSRGWAVMSMDLRGHGDSKTRNQRPLQPSSEWRTNPREFPVDLDPALDWLKSRPRVDNRKIVVIGSDVGANLALIASGKFSEVRTVVAINPSLNESFALAGSAQDFQPRSALIVTANQGDGDQIKAVVKAPSRVVLVRPAGARYGTTAQWTADKQVADAVFQWLKETY